MEFLAIPSLVIVLALWVVHSLILNRRLIQSQTRYRQFFSDSPVALILIDRNFRILEWNEAAQMMFGWRSGEAVKEHIIDLIVPDFDKAHVESVLHKAAKEGISYSKNYNITHKGHELFCEWRNRLLEETDGDILCMAQDITVSQKVLDDLQKRSTALESAGDAILYTDRKGLIEFANRSFFNLNLTDQSQVFGSHIGRYLFREQLNFNGLISQLDVNNTWRGTVSKMSATGEKTLSVTITAIYLRNRLISYIANLHDITEISTHVENLTHKIRYDFLTGAVNRATFNDRLDHAIARARRARGEIALFFIDLNDFKLINDHYGHEAGDKLLSSISRNLIACLRNSDTVCRYGGDEFIVLIEEIKGNDHISSILETIQTAITEPVFIDRDIVIHPKASIGVALYPDDALDAETLIKAADIAMYGVKKAKNSSKFQQQLPFESSDQQDTK